MTDWQRSGLCVDHDDPDLWFAYDPDDRARARRICARCPVRLDCAAWAVATGQRDGIWGGLDVEERRARRAVS